MRPADLLATPPDTDVAWQLLTTLLPTDDGATPFASVIGTLSTALVFAAAVWLGFQIVQALVTAARTGEPLTREQAGASAIVRVVVGIGLLVPVTSAGLSTAHYLLRDWVALPGINIANLAAEGAATLVVRDGQPLAPVSAGGRDVALAILESEVCVRAHDVARAWRHVAASNVAVLPPVAGTPVVSPARSSWLPWGEDTPESVTGFAWSWGPACGSLTVSAATDFGGGAFGEARRGAVGAIVAGVREAEWLNALAEELRSVSLVRGHGPEYAEVLREAGALPTDLAADLRAAGEAYDRALSADAVRLTAADASTADMRALVLEDVRERGWYALGSYYRVMAHTSLSATSAVAERAERMRPNPDAWETLAGPVGSALAVVEAYGGRSSAAARLAQGDALTGQAEAESVLASVVQTVTLPVLDWLTAHEAPRVDPVSDLMSLGAILLVGAQAAWAVALAAYGGSALFAGVGGGLIDFLMVAGWPLIGLAWLGGAVLAYLLPLLPFLFATFALAAWAWEVIKAAIAVVVWAFLHVRLNGTDFVGKEQRQGYVSLVIGILLRPVVTVAAFVAMNAVNVAVLNGFLFGYNSAFKASQVGYSIGVTGVVIAVAVMIYVQWTIIVWSFRMVTEMPQKVAEFLGYSASAWGDGDAGRAVVGGVVGGGKGTPVPGAGLKSKAETGGGGGSGLRATPGAVAGKLVAKAGKGG
ncbi:DotA/TraY family protein [Aureimonas mangrovi]|uniref:DotA/TraY family protein n=1 Tax=Aureimonas mangrovi TaxID=2758041 RepID=UPI00163D9080|nr:DotA/TraY family protein [Aureimonas mangrovi]